MKSLKEDNDDGEFKLERKIRICKYQENVCSVGVMKLGLHFAIQKKRNIRA